MRNISMAEQCRLCGCCVKNFRTGRTGSTGFGTGIRIIYKWKSERICT